MKSRTILCRLLVLPLLLAVVIPAYAQKGNPQAILKQYVSELQNNPNDITLLEKIINHVRTMKPAPRVPEEARRHYVMAVTLLKNAKDMKDYSAAVEELKAALRIAPWWPEAYRSLGLASESAEQYYEAIVAFKLYLLTRPKGSDARNAQDEIYVIEAKQKKAAQDQTAALQREAEAKQAADAAGRAAEEKARLQAQEAENIRNLSGTWVGGGGYQRYRVTISGNAIEIEQTETFVQGGWHPLGCPGSELWQGTVQGSSINGNWLRDYSCVFQNGQKFTRPMNGTIGADRRKIDITYNVIIPAGANGNIANGFMDGGAITLTLTR